MSSNLKLFSIGIVLKDKLPNSWEIEVKPIETNGFSDGLITTDMEQHTISGVNANGESYSETTSSSHGVIAEWYPDQPNRSSAPDVTAGEEVELYKFADSDVFYWKATNISSKNRSHETIVVSVANKAQKDKKVIDSSNSYFMEMCTRTKHVTLKTNKSDGEPFAYTVQVNTKEGAIILEDDVGNLIQLSSTDNELTLESAAGSKIVIDTNIFMKTGGNVTIEAGGNISASAGGTIDMSSGGESTYTAGANYTVAAGGNYIVGGVSYVISTSNVNASEGSFEITSDVGIIGNLTNNDVNVGSTHTHTEQGDGKDVSTPK